MYEEYTPDIWYAVLCRCDVDTLTDMRVVSKEMKSIVDSKSMLQYRLSLYPLIDEKCNNYLEFAMWHGCHYFSYARKFFYSNNALDRLDTYHNCKSTSEYSKLIYLIKDIHHRCGFDLIDRHILSDNEVCEYIVSTITDTDYKRFLVSAIRHHLYTLIMVLHAKCVVKSIDNIGILTPDISPTLSPRIVHKNDWNVRPRITSETVTETYTTTKPIICEDDWDHDTWIEPCNSITETVTETVYTGPNDFVCTPNGYYPPKDDRLSTPELILEYYQSANDELKHTKMISVLESILDGMSLYEYINTLDIKHIPKLCKLAMCESDLQLMDYIYERYPDVLITFLSKFNDYIDPDTVGKWITDHGLTRPKIWCDVYANTFLQANMYNNAEKQFRKDLESKYGIKLPADIITNETSKGRNLYCTDDTSINYILNIVTSKLGCNNMNDSGMCLIGTIRWLLKIIPLNTILVINDKHVSMKIAIINIAISMNKTAVVDWLLPKLRPDEWSYIRENVYKTSSLIHVFLYDYQHHKDEVLKMLEQ